MLYPSLVIFFERIAKAAVIFFLRYNIFVFKFDDSRLYRKTKRKIRYYLKQGKMNKKTRRGVFFRQLSRVEEETSFMENLDGF